MFCIRYLVRQVDVECSFTCKQALELVVERSALSLGSLISFLPSTFNEATLLKSMDLHLINLQKRFLLPKLFNNVHLGCHDLRLLIQRCRFCTLLTFVPGRPLLRSSDANKLLVPWSCTTSFGLRSFGSSGPTAWNDMPAHLRNLDLPLSDFRQLLKTAFSRLFQCSYRVRLCDS